MLFRGQGCQRLLRLQQLLKGKKKIWDFGTQRDNFQVSSTGMVFLSDSVSREATPALPESKYGGVRFVTLLTGESLMGRQGAHHITSLVKIANVPIDFEIINLSKQRAKNTQEDQMSMLRNGIGVHIDLDVDANSRQRRSNLNKRFRLHACLTKFKSHPNFRSFHENVDIWSFCQNNVGDSTKLEYEPIAGMVESVRVTTADSLRRYFEFVYDYCTRGERKKVTIAHNVTKVPKSDGMFIEIAKDLQASKYQNLTLEFMVTNELAYNLIMNPQCLDVICSQYRYAHHLSAILAGVCGGAGLFSVMDAGENFVMFKPLETKLATSDSRSLSPYGIVRTCVDLLHHLGKSKCADVMDKELNTLMDNDIRTRQYGGTYTSEYIICHMVNNLKDRFNCNQ